jgi:hypothetical protein
VWAAVMDWPSSHTASVQADVVHIVDRWIETQSMQTLLSLAPWLAAVLARVSTVFARHYVPGLLRTGVHTHGTVSFPSLSPFL